MSESDGEYKQKPFPGWIMINEQKLKNDPDDEYFRKISSIPNKVTDEINVGHKNRGEEKSSKKHPWGVEKGAYAYANRWLEDGYNEMLGELPESVNIYEINKEQDGPYFSVQGYIINPSEDLIMKLKNLGLDRPFWVIGQKFKNQKGIKWMGNYDKKENKNESK